MPQNQPKFKNNRAVESPEKLRGQRSGYWRQIIMLSFSIAAIYWIGWRSPLAKVSPKIEVKGDVSGMPDSPAPIPVPAASLMAPTTGNQAKSTNGPSPIEIIPTKDGESPINFSDDGSVNKKPRKRGTQKAHNADEATIDESSAAGTSND